MAVHLQMPPSLKIHPTFDVSCIKPFLSSHFVPSSRPPPPTQLINVSSTSTVRRLRHSRWWSRGLHYLVDWEGYGPKERSWVPAHNILDKTLFCDFHSSHPDQPVSPSGARPSWWGYVIFLPLLSCSLLSCSVSPCSCYVSSLLLLPFTMPTLLCHCNQ